MAFAPLFDPTNQFMTKAGTPLFGGRLYVYLDGTENLATVKNIEGTTIQQPIATDANGRATGGVFVSDGSKYRLEVRDPYNALLWSVAGMSPLGGGGGGVGVQADWTENDSDDPSYIQNKPTLATVATTGKYSDLTGKPTIPAEQVNSDWSAQYGKAKILNKPLTMPNATGGLRKTLDADDISNGYVEFKIATGGSYTGPYTFTNPAFVLFGSISQIRYNSGSAATYIDTAEVGLYSEGISGKYIQYYTHSHAELVADNAKGWGVSGWWSLAKDKYLSVYVRLTLTSSATAGDEVFCHFVSGIFGTGLFQY